MERFNLAVYIGRFQPFHKAHLEICLEGFKIADHLLVIVGSRSKGRRTFKNPWTSDEREQMIRRSLNKHVGVTQRLHVASIFDVPGDDEAWREQVHELIDGVIYDDIEDPLGIDQSDPKVTLIGHKKDDSSYYLQTFPRLVYSPVAVSKDAQSLNATDIRARIMLKLPYGNLLPDGTQEFLKGWLQTHQLPKE